MSGGVYFTLSRGGRIFLSSLDHVVVDRAKYDYLVKYYEWRTDENWPPPTTLKQKIMAHICLRKPLK